MNRMTIDLSAALPARLTQRFRPAALALLAGVGPLATAFAQPLRPADAPASVRDARDRAIAQRSAHCRPEADDLARQGVRFDRTEFLRSCECNAREFYRLVADDELFPGVPVDSEEQRRRNRVFAAHLQERSEAAARACSPR